MLQYSHMENIFEGYFYNPTRGNLPVEEVMEEMLNYIEEKPESFYDIVVGCDSSSEEQPNFPVALVILRKGEGGRFFLKKVKYQNKKFYNMQQRILEEVMLSCEMALFLREKFEGRVDALGRRPNFQFRYIHADVGENGPTRDMIKEVAGLIWSNGFEPKIKPEAFVASVVADRYS